jgi:hypothetical protein
MVDKRSTLGLPVIQPSYMDANPPAYSSPQQGGTNMEGFTILAKPRGAWNIGPGTYRLVGPDTYSSCCTE